ncbi:MAG: MBL fold metallo-hydrolase [Planctomycetes bacterium]|nr:MBL fold metallo-hydrolase [Planctomycetota bacterium]
MLVRNPPVEVTDRITMLGTNEYPIYLVRGTEGAALFEGGSGPMGPVVREQLEQLGIDAAQIKQIVIPHAHPDHVMAVPSLRSLCSGATVLASEIAAKTLSAEKAIGLFCRLDDAVTDWLIQTGRIRDDQRRPPLETQQIAVDQILKEGDAVTVDGSSFEVLATPGHSDCSLSFYDAATGVLIISDATPYYMPDLDAWWPGYFSGYEAYVASMERLASLGAEVVCLGHHAAVRGADAVKDFFQRAIAAAQSYHERIVSEKQAGKSTREIAEQLGQEIYEKTPSLSLDFFQKNCALMVKQSLRAAGVSED